MEEKKFVQFKKDEFGVREFIKNSLGIGIVSGVDMEYTPVGEKIIVYTTKPGLVIGRRGEKIDELTGVLKKRFKLENPHIEIAEITRPELDAQIMADEIALLIERQGTVRFKMVAYKILERIIHAGALGVEIVLSGKLPGERAKSWRFASGYLKKTGDTAKIVGRAKSTARTVAGVVGIKVGILPPDVQIHDRIIVNDEMKQKIASNLLFEGKQAAERAEAKSEKKPEAKKAAKPRKKKDAAEAGGKKEDAENEKPAGA
ncbi:30S ribosomal protein S3 [Candidatus Pacearchaeota archaeon]|nr:30S ribosomal protein S3 [Candidatus Pacearchaeota archaeon]